MVHQHGLAHRHHVGDGPVKAGAGGHHKGEEEGHEGHCHHHRRHAAVGAAGVGGVAHRHQGHKQGGDAGKNGNEDDGVQHTVEGVPGKAKLDHFVRKDRKVQP